MLRRFLRTLWITGIRFRCPVCETGGILATPFRLNKTCPHCGVRFERETGEETGGMSVSIVVLGVIFLIGYPLLEIFTDWSLWVHLAIWIPFAILFPIVFYPFSRSLWVVFLYLTNSIKKDSSDYYASEVSIIDAFQNRQVPPKPQDK